ncbi:MAG: hypothetical protein NC200_06045 [Candidatus Gastranaerophilales bacterium]|nr:hypothetical protein [Candidatus Gastranaerophilales bacterium]
METELTQGLTFLTWTTAGFLIIVGVFVVKLLFDLSRLTCNLNKSAKIVHTELEPILKNVGESAATINKFVQYTDKKVGKFTETYDKVSSLVIKSVTKASALSGLFAKTVLKGLFSALKGIFKSK